MKIVLLFLLATISCNQIGTVEINNLSNRKIDKVQIYINSHRYVMKNIAPKSKSIYKFNKFDVDSKHDVVYGFTGYLKDSVFAARSFFSNDLGFVPDSVRLNISDSLKFEFVPLIPKTND